MRLILIAILAALPLTAEAQSRAKDPDAAPQLPTIGQPLPQIGLPLPSIGLPPAEKPNRRADRRDPDKPREPQNPRGRGRGNRSTVYVLPVPVPVYGSELRAASDETSAKSEPAEALPPPPQTGIVSLDVEFDTSAQIFVDTYYVGTTDELGRDLILEAGPHAIELRAPGREPVSVNVKVEAGRTIAYRAPRQAAPAAAPSPSTERDATAKPDTRPLYVVPGCYIGNVPPKEAALPANCDVRRMTMIRR